MRARHSKVPSCQRKKRESVFGIEQKSMLQYISTNENFNSKRLKKTTLDSSNHWCMNILKFETAPETLYCIFTIKLFVQDLIKRCVPRTFHE